MAIMGTVIIEDCGIHFTVTTDNQVVVTVTDSFKGESETYTTDAGDFMVALGTALHFSGESVDHVAAERAQPTNPALRFIP